MKRQVIPISTTEIVIQYVSPYSKGEMIIDTNFFTKNSKVIMRKLKGCEITSMCERKKQ